ncbi:MAG: HAMP domain-containing sensor histidine kinase, partial [Ornithinimicrobium sp.]
LSTTAMRLSELLHRERALGAATSHQLRTPVMRLQLLLDSARHTPAVPGQQDRPALIEEAASEAQNLGIHLEELLRLTRAGAGEASSSDEVDLPAVLDQVHKRYEAVAGEHQRRVVVGLDHDLPPVTGSAAAISHALDVLVDNAMQHGQGTVRVWARQTVDTVAIDVSDEGPGFSTHTGHGSDTPPRRSGLGLDLAAALVEAQAARLILPGAARSSRVSIILSPRRDA